MVTQDSSVADIMLEKWNCTDAKDCSASSLKEGGGMKKEVPLSGGRLREKEVFSLKSGRFCPSKAGQGIHPSPR